jgi:DNA polymerase III subunit delta'
MKFSQVIGNTEIKEHLASSAQQGRISHAQLFISSEGGGNLALALAYVQYILCPNRTAKDSCGQCPACQKITNLIHPDLHFVFPIAGKENIEKYHLTFRETLRNNAYITLGDWHQAMKSDVKNAVIYAWS